MCGLTNPLWYSPGVGWRGEDRRTHVAFVLVVLVVLVAVELVLNWDSRLFMAVVLAIVYLGVVGAKCVRSRR